jgi:hypothetical protein
MPWYAWTLLALALLLALGWGLLLLVVRVGLWRPPPWRAPYDTP